MAELIHADMVQQLEVVLLGSSAADVVELLSAGLEQIKPILQTMQPHPRHIPLPIQHLSQQWSLCLEFQPYLFLVLRRLQRPQNLKMFQLQPQNAIV